MIVVALIALPFSDRWGSAALLLLAFALCLDLEKRLEDTERRLRSILEGQGSDPRPAEARRGLRTPSPGPWRDK